MVVFATASAGAEIGSALCTARGGDAALEAPTADSFFTGVRDGKTSTGPAFFPATNASCAFHSHGTCAQISPDPALALRTLQRPFVPAPPVGVTDASTLFGDSHHETALRNCASACPVRFAHTRSLILRC